MYLVWFFRSLKVVKHATSEKNCHICSTLLYYWDNLLSNLFLSLFGRVFGPFYFETLRCFNGIVPIIYVIAMSSSLFLKQRRVPPVGSGPRFEPGTYLAAGHMHTIYLRLTLTNTTYPDLSIPKLARTHHELTLLQKWHLVGLV